MINITNKYYNFITLISILIFLFASQVFSKVSSEALKVLVPSENRFVADLSGTWEKTYDMSNWTTSELPTSELHTGKVIYKRVVKIPAGMTENYSWSLYFLGVNHQIEVYWNEQFIGRYVGAMMPFDVKIPNRSVRDDVNEIRLVLLPAEGKIKQIQSQQLNSRQYFTGLIRDVLLIGTAQAWISDIKYTSKIKSAESAELFADVSISSTDVKNLVNKLKTNDSISINSKDKLNINLSVELKKINSDEVLASANSKTITIESNRTVIEKFALSSNNINLWNTDNPQLYELVVKIKRGDFVIDDYRLNVGFRSFVSANTNNGQKLLLNGEYIRLQGVSYIEDYNGNGATISEYQIKSDIAQIKKLGANVVRVMYNPPSPLFVHYCNLNGLMLMVELPLYDAPSKMTSLDEVKIYLQNIAKQYILRYNNDISIVAWGLGAGVAEDENYYKNFSESVLKIFARDSDKLKYKIIPHSCNEIFTEGFDFIGYSDIRNRVDFQHINSEFIRIKELIKDKPLFMAYGEEIQLNNHNGYSDPLSIEYQAYSILNNYKIVEKNEGAGSIINYFNDYLQNKPSLTTKNENRYINTSGLTDRKRNERLAFATVQALFNNEKEPILNAGSYNPDTPMIYLIVGIATIMLLILLINRFKRFREYMFRSLLRPYNFYADIRDQRIISNLQTLLLGLIISISVGVYFSSILFYYKDSEFLEYLIMLFVPVNYLRDWAYELVWMPELSFILITIISYLLSVLTAWLIRMIAIISRARIFWSDCMTIAIWSALPAIVLLPLSIVVMRLILLSPSSIWVFLSIYLFTSIWTIKRLLRSIAVVFDISTVRTYLIGCALIAVIVVSLLGFYQIKYSFFEYWSYFSNTILS